MSNNNFLANESTSVLATKLSAWDNTGIAGEKIPANVPTNPDGTAHAQALTDAQLRLNPVPVSFSGEIEVKNDSGNPLSVTNSAITNGSAKSQIINSSGDIVDVKTLATQVVSTDKGIITNSVIHGLSSAGGGTYVDVKVNPSGALTADITGSSVSISGTPNVAVTSSVLPTGAATSANQTTSNTSLNNIDNKTPALGQALAAASVPVVLTAAQLTTLTPLSSVAISNTVAVTLASIPLATNAATDRTLASAPYSNRLSDGTAFYDARSIRALTSSDVVTVANPVSSVSVSNFPATQNVSVTNASIPVTGTFFQATQPVSNTLESSAAGTITSVTNAIASFTVLAANANRKGFIIHNDSTTTVFIAFAATASSAAFTLRLTSQASYFYNQLPRYTGVISGIALAANGALRITELT